MARKKRLGAVASLLAAACCLGLLAGCGGATTMHLRRTEGTVAVQDEKAAPVTIKENLSLYGGYQVDTGAQSYAWVDLDAVKLTKLDEDTQVEIHRDGAHLELVVLSGSLFFQVTEPLTEKESLTVRTSDMLVGIRGTCGWVSYGEAGSVAALLEGTVTCQAVAGDEVRLEAGQKAVLAPGGTTITVSPLSRQDLPAFIAGEADAALAVLESGFAAQEKAERQRKAALLAALDGEEMPFYAALGDLNEDGAEDLLVFGPYTRTGGGMPSVTFGFHGYLWQDGAAQRVELTQTDYLDAFGSDSYTVWRARTTGGLYAGYSFAMDSSDTQSFENALGTQDITANVREGGGELDYPENWASMTEQEQNDWLAPIRAQNEADAAAKQAQIDAQYELVADLAFPYYATYNGYDFDSRIVWESYLNGSPSNLNPANEQPPFPPYTETVAQVRAALAA